MLRKLCFRIILSMLVIAACSGEKTINWVGDGISKKSYIEPLVREYRKRNGVEIILEEGGSTKAIHDVSAGLVELGGSSRYKLDIPDEKHAVLIPVAWDALVVIVNRQNPLSNLSIDQVKSIFIGETGNWAKVGGDDYKITLCISKGRVSGVGRMTDAISFYHGDRFYGSRAVVFPSAGPLEAEVERNVDAIGITGFGSALKSKVKILAIDGIVPTKENIIADTYPFCLMLYLVYHEKYDEKAADFVQFARGPVGQKIISSAGIINWKEGAPLIIAYKKEMADLGGEIK